MITGSVFALTNNLPLGEGTGKKKSPSFRKKKVLLPAKNRAI